MLGRLNGVAAHIKEANPSVLIQGCPCHFLHLAAKKASDKLTVKCEDFLIDLFFYLENSSKRQKALENFQRESGVVLKKILKHEPTRWLSLLTCLQRLEEMWEPVTRFIESEVAATKSASNARLIRIDEFLHNPASRLYIFFLTATLPIYINANLLLQREDPVIHLMRQRLMDVATDIIVCFVKPAALTKAANLYKLEHGRRSRQKDREDLVIGEKARSFLALDKVESRLTNTSITQFFEDVRAFYSTSLAYIFEKLPLDSDLLEHCEILDISKRAQHKFSSVRYFIKQFKCLEESVDISVVEREFAKFQVHPLPGLNLTGRIDEAWVEVGQLKDSSGQLMFGSLAKIMLAVASIPHSNATSERIFSLVRKNKTEQRASMSRESLTDVIRIKTSMLASGQECYSFKIDKGTLAAAKTRCQ